MSQRLGGIINIHYYERIVRQAEKRDNLLSKLCNSPKRILRLNFIFVKADFTADESSEQDKMASLNGTSHNSIDDELDFSDIEAKCGLLALSI